MTRRNENRKNTTRLTRAVAQSPRVELHAAVDALVALLSDTSSEPRLTPHVDGLSDLPAKNVYSRLNRAAEALMTWHTSDAYLTSKGLPQPLPLNGAVSLYALAKSVAPDRKRAMALRDDLVALALVSSTSSGYLPSNRSLILGESRPHSLAYASIAISRLIETMIHNFSNKRPRRFERQVAEVKILKSDLPAFLRFAEQQGQYLIDGIDDWLASRRAPESASARSVAVGLSAFAWVVDGHSTTVRTRKATRGMHPRR